MYSNDHDIVDKLGRRETPSGQNLGRATINREHRLQRYEAAQKVLSRWVRRLKCRKHCVVLGQGMGDTVDGIGIDFHIDGAINGSAVCESVDSVNVAHGESKNSGMK